MKCKVLAGPSGNLPCAQVVVGLINKHHPLTWTLGLCDRREGNVIRRKVSKCSVFNSLVVHKQRGGAQATWKVDKSFVKSIILY